MITDDNSIGVIHWEGMFAGTDGEQINLVIPGFFRSHHIPFLNSVLASRLPDCFDEEGIEFRLEAGETRSALAHDRRPRVGSSRELSERNVALAGSRRALPVQTELLLLLVERDSECRHEVHTTP
jgi:hypothetical protein